MVKGSTATIAAVVLIVIMTLSGFFAPKGVNYFLVFVAMLLFFVLLGIFISGRPAGILIDERNQMSLSRFQMVVWMLIILSAYLTIALSRITAGLLGGEISSITDALSVGIPQELWVLLGISTVSLVGSPLILSEKKNKKGKFFIAKDIAIAEDESKAKTKDGDNTSDTEEERKKRYYLKVWLW